MKQRIHALFATFGLGILLVAPLMSHAQAIAPNSGRLYFQPANVSVSSGKNVSMDLRVDGMSDTNLVHAVVHYPSDKLAFVGLDKSSSFFDTFVPASPKADNGTLTFSAASLGKTTSTDQLVAAIVFKAISDSGTAQLSLDDSTLANNGQERTPQLSNATVAFTAGSSSTSQVQISQLKITNVTINSGQVQWKTNIPTTSSVDYGLTTNYGFSAGSKSLVTDHSVTLDKVFGGAATIHVRVSSVSDNGSSLTSGDKTFKTLGYSVAITVTSADNSPIKGADVQVSGGSATKTDNNGVARLDNVNPGNQKVSINHGKNQFITVKAVNGKAASAIQTFKLKGETSGTSAWTIVGLIAAVIIVVGLLSFLIRRRQTQSVLVSK